MSPHGSGSVTPTVQGEVVLRRLMLRSPILTSSCWKGQGWAVAAAAAAAAALVSALCSGESQVKAADGLSRLTTLAPRLTPNATQGKSNERRPEPVKVPHGWLGNFDAWIRTKREVRGSCRHQLELSRRISTEDRLARELARLQTVFNWLWVGWLLSPCHSDSSEKYNKGQRPWELHDKPKAEFEA